MEILDKNGNSGQKWKFWTKMEYPFKIWIYVELLKKAEKLRDKNNSEK